MELAPLAATRRAGALVIFPAEMHEVQTRTLRLTPSVSTIRADWRFGNHRRLVLLFAWLTLLPFLGVFPQT